MKSLTVHYLILFFFMAAVPAIAQPVVKTDPATLVKTLVPPAANATTAFSRAFIEGGKIANTAFFYKSWNASVEKMGQEIQAMRVAFYKQYPTGVRPVAQPAGHASPQQQAAINSASSDLAQKMLADPALAQKIMAMSEVERHEYIAKLLAEKGVKPVAGTPNTNYTGPGGIDINWVELSQKITQPALDPNRWQAQQALSVKYAELHQAVNEQANAEVEKLPMIEMGEYGHDHDPEKVKAIQQRARAQHRDLASAMLREVLPIFDEMCRDFRTRIQPFQDALKMRNFGEGYDFGQSYIHVLDTQMAIVMELASLSKYAANVTDEAARWEADWRRGEK